MEWPERVDRDCGLWEESRPYGQGSFTLDTDVEVGGLTGEGKETSNHSNRKAKRSVSSY